MKMLKRIVNAYNSVLAIAALSAACRNDTTLHTKVIKAGVGYNVLKASRCESTHQVWHKAGVWIPDHTIRVLHILIAEQSEIALYVDIEVSLHPKMLSADQDEQLFRYKYAGPAVQWSPPCPVQYAGSNTTNNIINLAPQGIVIQKGTPIYPPSQKATAVRPWMNAGRVSCEALCEVGLKLRRVPHSAKLSIQRCHGRKPVELHVHLDVINWAPIDINNMTQDVTLYYTLED